ncbi:MAG: cytochrome c oxidase subunit 3 [Hyphomicrobiales bacterium]|nr:cytochrome c oxidase subunit 3 [Hyphomicrobiales bacterium]
MSEAAGALREPWHSLSRQREAAAFGIWLFLASELLFFGGMLLCYAVCRYSHPQGFLQAARQTNIVFGTVNTLTLVTSSFCMAIASESGKSGLRRLAIGGLAGTLMLGFVFLVIKGLEYRDDISQHLVPGAGFALPQLGAQLFFSLYWMMTGVHALHLTVGMIIIARLVLVGIRRELPLTSPEIQVTALYWHLVDIIWIILYPLLYLGGRA